MLQNSKATYFAPYDDCQSALQSLVNSAQKSIRIADYSFNTPELVDLLIQKHQSGMDVSLVLDKSQAGGKVELPEVDKLKTAGVPLVLGTSDKHKIMHLKVCIIDGETVAFGSYNFTTTAELEDNVLRIEHDPLLAQAFLSNWQAVHDWIVQTEGGQK